MTDQTPVVLIHGLGDTELLFSRMLLTLQERGRTAHCINLKPNNGDAGLDELALQVRDHIGATCAHAPAIDLVGFSMGGLVARYYLQRLGGIGRVRRFVSVSSPHNGTWTAYLRSSAGIRQMRPGSSFLRDLNRDAAMLERISVTSIWTPFDLMILPANSSVLASGRTIRVRVPAHVLMMRNPRVVQHICEALGEPINPDDTQRRQPRSSA